MKPIDRVRNAYQGKRRSIVVPEWGNLELWFGPLTVEDMVSIDERVGGNGNLYERSIYMLIHKARTQQGEPIFAFGDVKVLKTEADIAIVNRIIAAMTTDVPTLEQADEAIATDPT